MAAQKKRCGCKAKHTHFITTAKRKSASIYLNKPIQKGLWDQRYGTAIALNAPTNYCICHRKTWVFLRVWLVGFLVWSPQREESLGTKRGAKKPFFFCVCVWLNPSFQRDNEAEVLSCIIAGTEHQLLEVMCMHPTVFPPLLIALNTGNKWFGKK